MLIIFQQVDVSLNEPVKLDELIKLAHQSIQRRTRYRKGKDNNNFLRKQKRLLSKHRNKKCSEKCYVFTCKRQMWKNKKTLLQWILQNILENQAFHRTEKLIEMEGIVLLVKVDQMYNILKSVLATVLRNSHINVSSKQALSKWMHSQQILTLWELQQITDMLYVRKVPEHIVTDVYIFMLLNL